MENNYNSIIYAIIDNDTKEQYIGSTFRDIKTRIQGHLSVYKQYLKGKSNFVTSFKILERNNYKVEVLAYCGVNNKQELHEIEKQHIKNSICVNKVIPNRNKYEYYADNKETILQNVHQYARKNKTKILKKHKEYREKNKEKLIEYQKHYKETHLEKVKEYKAQYYQNNKDNLIAPEILKCDCGGSYGNTAYKKSRHEQSTKHKNYLSCSLI